MNQNQDMCVWTLPLDGKAWQTWETSCGKAFVMIDGAPSDNGMKFCCYCGKPLWDVVEGEE
jgi:hypothetical protein